jgi:hypothetical protein
MLRQLQCYTYSRGAGLYYGYGCRNNSRETTVTPHAFLNSPIQFSMEVLSSDLSVYELFNNGLGI